MSNSSQGSNKEGVPLCKTCGGWGAVDEGSMAYACPDCSTVKKPLKVHGSMSTKKTTQPRRFIIEVHDNIPPAQALLYCMKVAEGGEVSGPSHRKQHCYHTVFQNGASVSCVKRGKSERFIVEHKA